MASNVSKLMKLLAHRYRWLGLILSVAGAIALIALGSADGSSWRAQAQPAPLRRVNPVAIATEIYLQVPELPLENQYISNETGVPAADNTLVSRFVRYHVYTKERLTNLRLEWKLTLADYLGAFESILAADYPDYGLRQNPVEGDITAVRGLSRELRDRLVNRLYELFTAPLNP